MSKPHKPADSDVVVGKGARHVACFLHPTSCGVCQTAIAGKPGSHRDVSRTKMLRTPPVPCGSKACPRWQSPCRIVVECADAIASRLAPTVICAVHKCCVHQHYRGSKACPRWQSPCRIVVECADAIASRLAPTEMSAEHKCCMVMFAMAAHVSKCIISLSKARGCSSIIAQGHDYYHSKIASTPPPCRLACTHSSIVHETPHDSSEPSASGHRDDDPRHGPAICLLLWRDRGQHLLCPADHWPDRAGHRPDQMRFELLE